MLVMGQCNREFFFVIGQYVSFVHIVVHVYAIGFILSCISVKKVNCYVFILSNMFN